jgi:RNA polymerase sigma factor (sigma-70 family)
MEKGSVTRLFSGLASGQPAAQGQIVARFLKRVVGLARKKLKEMGTPCGAADEEDVALEVLNSFLVAVQQQGRLPALPDRKALWTIFAEFTVRKAVDAHRRATAQKRPPPGKQVSSGPGDSDVDVLERLVADESDPALEVQAEEQLRSLLQALPDDLSRSIVRYGLQGFTVLEIAKAHGVSPRTVERRLKKALKLWEEGLA